MVRQFLCANPGITLRETASNFGFYDEFHLSKAFKKQFGVAPKYLR
jgi:AraC-like DNA-binding protein